MGRVLVHGNNVGFDVYSFLSVEINPPTCPILYPWEGQTAGKGLHTHLIVPAKFSGSGFVELPQLTQGFSPIVELLLHVILIYSLGVVGTSFGRVKLGMKNVFRGSLTERFLLLVS